VTSALGALLPVIVKRSYSKHSKGTVKTTIAPLFFDFTKYLGSGIIISTAFVHLLSPAFEELKDPSLPEAWLQYDWAPVLTMTAVFAIFTVELLAHRLGTAWLNKLGVAYDPHGHAHSAHGPCEAPSESHVHPGSLDEDPTHDPHQDPTDITGNGDARLRHQDDGEADECDAHIMTDEESIRAPFLQKKASNGKLPSHSHKQQRGSGVRNGSYGSIRSNGTANPSAMSGFSQDSEQQMSQDSQNQSATQIIGVAILEFGVLLHSFVIGMTLAVVERFTTLFIVITLHQTFEGLGLGSRLANLKLPRKYRWVPTISGIVYAFITPTGLACGLLVRKTYDPDSPTALIVSGVLDSLSAGVLLYTGLVELLCAEFLFHQEMKEAPLKRVLGALACVILGAVIMAVLGIWA